ncbi:type II toxin-antitoxin system RelE/ParE family toxin [Candidatus Poribacteria bacterium]|nr:type II toxin-antitoxin system RelE/ParE family toxin [Candidatus Poribacteria bacterium]MYA72383.1 type II toxin-antitoxin system RelE/ParE family toxin [Candidatus Poribacteria bacterium]
MDHERINLRKTIWIGDSKARLKEFPQPVQKDIGDALFIVQAGSMSPAAKPFKGVGSGVFEIRSDYRTDTYRAVYAAKIGERVYVLHCFQKKSKRGIKTPKKEVDLIKRRLKMAQELEENYGQED